VVCVVLHRPPQQRCGVFVRALPGHVDIVRVRGSRSDSIHERQLAWLMRLTSCTMCVNSIFRSAWQSARRQSRRKLQCEAVWSACVPPILGRASGIRRRG
jgi:hypothetical protein